MTQLTTTEKLNLVGDEGTRAFIDLNCLIFYYWDEITEMVEENRPKEDVLHCLHEYREALKWSVRHSGKWNKRMYQLTKEALPGLIEPDYQKMIQARQILYDGPAGVK